MKRHWQMQGGLPVLVTAPLSVQSVEHEFGETLDEFEDQVFKEAVQFRLRQFGEGEEAANAETDNFETALKMAGGVLANPKRRVLIYAVAASGRFVCLERKKWAHFLELWRNKNATS